MIHLGWVSGTWPKSRITWSGRVVRWCFRSSKQIKGKCIHCFPIFFIEDEESRFCGSTLDSLDGPKPFRWLSIRWRKLFFHAIRWFSDLANSLFVVGEPPLFVATYFSSDLKSKEYMLFTDPTPKRYILNKKIQKTQFIKELTILHSTHHCLLFNGPNERSSQPVAGLGDDAILPLARLHVDEAIELVGRDGFGREVHCSGLLALSGLGVLQDLPGR